MSVLRRLTIRVTPRVASNIEMLADESGRSVSEQVSVLIDQALVGKVRQVEELSEVAAQVLATIGFLGGTLTPASVTQIADDMGLSTNLVGGVVGQFERRGWAELSKRHTPEGWRTFVALTPEGRIAARLASELKRGE